MKRLAILALEIETEDLHLLAFCEVSESITKLYHKEVWSARDWSKRQRFILKDIRSQDSDQLLKVKLYRTVLSLFPDVRIET